MIGVVDYGVGNLGAVCNMLRRLQIDFRLVDSDYQLSSCSKFILPGVGSFDNAMTMLSASGLRHSIEARVNAGSAQLMGICLGMQMLLSGSQEGSEQGLGLIQGHAERIPVIGDLKVPHMGWRRLLKLPKHAAFNYLDNTNRFYFAHSYYALPKCKSHALGSINYGTEITAIIGRDNILGVQFHPEKSHRFGMQLLQGFNQWSL